MAAPDPRASTPERFVDGFLGRMAANLVAMAGVAFCTLWLVDQRDEARHDQEETLRAEVEQLRFERDRMHRLNQELARELHDAGVSSEVARWQLRYTEERLRRTEAEAAASQQRATARMLSSAPAARAAEPTRPPRGSEPGLGARPSFEALDAPAEEHLKQSVERIAMGAPQGSGQPRTPNASQAAVNAAAAPAQGSGLDPDRFDPIQIPSLAGSSSQFDRNAAHLEWRRVLSEALDAECGTRSGPKTYACRDELERRLFPYSERAVHCLTSGNAEPDYVAVTETERLPTHSVPLDHGAVILCDGALKNL